MAKKNSFHYDNNAVQQHKMVYATIIFPMGAEYVEAITNVCGDSDAGLQPSRRQIQFLHHPHPQAKK